MDYASLLCEPWFISRDGCVLLLLLLLLSSPQPRAPEISGHCLGTAGPHHELQMSVGTARPRRSTASAKCQRDCHKDCQIECQTRRQIECQIECRNIYICVCVYQIKCRTECQIECQMGMSENIYQTECQIECQNYMSDTARCQNMCRIEHHQLMRITRRK